MLNEVTNSNLEERLLGRKSVFLSLYLQQKRIRGMVWGGAT